MNGVAAPEKGPPCLLPQGTATLARSSNPGPNADWPTVVAGRADDGDIVLARNSRASPKENLRPADPLMLLGGCPFLQGGPIPALPVDAHHRESDALPCFALALWDVVWTSGETMTWELQDWRDKLDGTDVSQVSPPGMPGINLLDPTLSAKEKKEALTTSRWPFVSAFPGPQRW
jgi:hypothetical protein